MLNMLSKQSQTLLILVVALSGCNAEEAMQPFSGQLSNTPTSVGLSLAPLSDRPVYFELKGGRNRTPFDSQTLSFAEEISDTHDQADIVSGQVTIREAGRYMLNFNLYALSASHETMVHYMILVNGLAVSSYISEVHPTSTMVPRASSAAPLTAIVSLKKDDIVTIAFAIYNYDSYPTVETGPVWFSGQRLSSL